MTSRWLLSVCLCVDSFDGVQTALRKWDQLLELLEEVFTGNTTLEGENSAALWL